MRAMGCVMSEVKEIPMNSIVVERQTIRTPAKIRSRFGRRAILLSAAAIAIGAGIAVYGAHWLTVGQYLETTDDAYVGGDVTVISPKVAGNIAQVAVTDNQFVHAGDLLLTIDDRDYRAALAKADAAVAGDEATLANLDATRKLEEAMVAQAQANIVAADAETVRARDDDSRYRQLAATFAASVQRSQQAEAEFKEASAGGSKARAAEVAAERQLDVIDTQKQQAQAALAGSIASRETARLNLIYTELRAPIDGVIGNRSARLGAYVAAGTQLISLVPAHGLWVDANFKEDQIAHLRPGLPVTITADVLPGTTFHGHVASIAPATGAQFSVLPPENATGNFTKIVQRVPIRIALDAGDSNLGALRPGLSTTVVVNTHPDSSSAQ